MDAVTQVKRFGDFEPGEIPYWMVKTTVVFRNSSEPLSQQVEDKPEAQAGDDSKAE